MTDTNVPSPRWGNNTKLVVGLTIVAIVAALVVRFSNILVPILFTFMVSYLLHPVASLIERKTKLTWRGAVNIVYLILLVLAVGFLVALGVALVQQLLNLVDVITNLVNDLPTFAGELSEQGFRYTIAGYTLDLTQLIEQLDIDILALSNQILEVLKPILGEAGSILGGAAASTFNFLAWGAFVFIVSYFLLADAGNVPSMIVDFEIPGIVADFNRMGRELGRIWNAFLRGQLFLFATAVVFSFVILAVAGVQNALGLAFLVGFGKFIPFLGPMVANISVALVVLFQQGNYLNIEPIYLVVIVVGILIVMDQIFDGIIAPRLYGNVLGIHPAALLVNAYILASLIGVAGIVLAAPVLASAQLFTSYTMRKILDQDPWKEPEDHDIDLEIPFEEPIRQLVKRIRKLFTRKRKRKND